MLLKTFLKGMKESDYLFTKDGGVNYYDLIVSEARNAGNYRLGKHECRSRLESLFKKHSVQFEEDKFNQAYQEFITAGAPRMVYRSY